MTTTTARRRRVAEPLPDDVRAAVERALAEPGRSLSSVARECGVTPKTVGLIRDRKATRNADRCAVPERDPAAPVWVLVRLATDPRSRRLASTDVPAEPVEWDPRDPARRAVVLVVEHLYGHTPAAVRALAAHLNSPDVVEVRSTGPAGARAALARDLAPYVRSAP